MKKILLILLLSMFLIAGANALQVVYNPYTQKLDYVVGIVNISVVGNISADYFFGSAAYLSDLNVTGNVTLSLESSDILNPFWVNKTGDIMSGNLTVIGNVSAIYLTGDGRYLLNLNIYNQTYEAMFNETYLSTYNQTYESIYNSSYLSTYNQSYDEFAYNQTIPANAYTDSVNASTASWINAIFLKIADFFTKKADNFYLYNDTNTIYFNETKMNETIDLRANHSIYNQTYESTYNSSYEGTGISSELLNETISLEGYRLGYNSTYNATYDIFAYNQTQPAMDWAASQDWNSTYNETYESTYNQTYEDFVNNPPQYNASYEGGGGINITNQNITVENITSLGYVSIKKNATIGKTLFITSFQSMGYLPMNFLNTAGISGFEMLNDGDISIFSGDASDVGIHFYPNNLFKYKLFYDWSSARLRFSSDLNIETLALDQTGNVYVNQSLIVNGTSLADTYVDISGDAMSGELNMGGNNLTDIGNISFSAGGYIIDNGTALIIGHS